MQNCDMPPSTIPFTASALRASGQVQTIALDHMICFTVIEKAADKEFIPTVGDMMGYQWTAPADSLVDEVQFTSTYTSSYPAYNANKHIQVAGIHVEVANHVVDHIDTVMRKRDHHIYNIYGVCVDGQPLRPGIYVRGGKKFIVK